jgi:hypothetical protein
LQIVVPITLLIIFLLLFLNFRSLTCYFALRLLAGSAWFPIDAQPALRARLFAIERAC